MKRTLFHLALGSAVVTTAFGAGFAVRSDRAAYKPRIAVCKIKEDETKAVSPAARISTTYRDGVCLIVGTYSFTGLDGRPLRYLESIDENGELMLGFQGTGAVYREEVTFTGFAVENGKILTTRRIAEPWFGDWDDKRITGLDLQPQLEGLTAYFPASRKPFKLTVEKASTESGLALCSFNPERENIPVLPLADSLTATPPGQAVVLMGFPTGVESSITRRYPNRYPITEDGPKVVLVEPAASLAASGDLLPDVSTGLVTRSTGSVTYSILGRLTHDAPTTRSGTGSPLFGPDGTVIGICEVPPSPGLTEKQVPDLNLAVSIQKVREFLDGKSTKTVAIETTKKR
jgi:serine protease Do